MILSVIFSAVLAVRLVGPSAPSTRHQLVFFTTPVEKALEACDSILMSVSDPASPKYGQHLPFAEMSRFHSAEHAETIAVWASSVKGLSVEVAPNKEFVKVVGSVEQLASLVGHPFNAYVTKDKSLFHRITADDVGKDFGVAFLPESIRPAVDFVHGLTGRPRFPMRPPASSRRLVKDVDAPGIVTPQLLYSTYSIQNRTVAHPGATQCIFASLDQSFAPADLKAFQKKYNLPASTFSKVKGPNNPNACRSDPNNCVEANLDVQQMSSIAQGAMGTFWSVPEENNDIFLEFVLEIAATPDAPLVYSISYGSLALEDDKNDMRRFNLELCKLGARGITVMVASGDDGVANFKARDDESQCGFDPSYPATSPYTTAVGATQGIESGKKEVACTSDFGGIITTGGGFSYIFPRPSYQDKQVLAYMQAAKATLPPPSQYNPNGRGYPDISLAGFNYPVFVGGQLFAVSGTSASSPAFAGLVTLINGARLAAGKSAVGFLNPALYSLSGRPGIYNDVSLGRNNCCAGDPGSQVCCQYGFNATSGWDPLTGNGTPNFDKLLAAFLNF